MKQIFITLAIFFMSTVLWSQTTSPSTKSYVKITTEKGSCIVKLYDETPLHRDNFLKLATDSFYNGTLFHRVIKDFMIQGGDPTSKNATPDMMLGSGNVDYRIPFEFKNHLIHKKGTLAAARDNNPEKASSGCQFYLVQGKKWTDMELNQIENYIGLKYTPEQRLLYKTLGGAAFLDNNYTVYGEIVKGMEMVDIIADVPKGANDRPLTDIKMQVSVLSPQEVEMLEKELIPTPVNPTIKTTKTLNGKKNRHK